MVSFGLSFSTNISDIDQNVESADKTNRGQGSPPELSPWVINFTEYLISVSRVSIGKQRDNIHSWLD